MLESLLFIFIGAMIGWNLPQPPWAKMVQAKVQKMWQEFRSK